MQSKATTVEQYLRELPPERRVAMESVRAVILRNLDPLVQEGMQYGMIGYSVPHSVYPPGYHCDPRQPLPFAGLASQKQHMSMYVMMTYFESDQDAWLRDRWAASGKRLDMGKCCIRFRRLEDVPLDVVAEVFKRVTVKDYIAHYERTLADLASARAARKAGRVPEASGTKAARGGASAAGAGGASGGASSKARGRGSSAGSKGTGRSGAPKGGARVKGAKGSTRAKAATRAKR